MQTINLDLSTKNVIPLLHAKQGDVGKKFKVTITNDGKPHSLAGSVFSVWYAGPSGDGNYTNIGDASAFSAVGNSITVELITQMLTNAGKGELCLMIHTADGKKIGMWNIPYYVEEVPGAGSQEAKMYYDAFQKAVKDLPYPDETLSISGKAADAAAVGRALTGAISIPNGEDLDSLVMPGRYACETVETAKTLLGCPVDVPFTLDVRYANGAGPHVGQELRPAGTKARLYRQFVGHSEILGKEAKAIYDRVRGLKPQGSDYTGNADTGWYDGSGDYTLSDAAELYGFAQLVNDGNTFEGEIVRLGADIIVNDGDAAQWSADNAPKHWWTPIGYWVSGWPHVFKGTFDGQGHFISGLYCNREKDSCFIDCTRAATIKNLAIINSYFCATGNSSGVGEVLASVVGRGIGITIQNVYSDTRIENLAKDWHTGGLVGYAKYSTDYGYPHIDNCVFEGSIVSTAVKGNAVGGILGGTDNSANITITNCLSAGTIDTCDQYIGGIAGYLEHGCTVTNCISATVARSTLSAWDNVALVGLTTELDTIEGCIYPKGARKYGSGVASGSGNTALATECTDNGMMPTGWAKVYDSTNKPTPAELGEDDYIVAQGTSGNWTYRKWASGIAECWGSSTGATDCNTKYGTIYTSNPSNYYGRRGLPFEFAEVPKCFPVANNDDRNPMYTSYWVAEQIPATLGATPALRFLSVNSVDTLYYDVNWYVVGRWK